VPKDVTLSIRITAEMAAEIAEEAKAKDVPMSQVIRDRLKARAVYVGHSDSGMMVMPQDFADPQILHHAASTKREQGSGTNVQSVETSSPATQVERPDPCSHSRVANVAKGKKCLDCRKTKKLNGPWV
jgi:hypothetical protein